MRLSCRPLVLASLAVASVWCLSIGWSEETADTSGDAAAVRKAANEYLAAMRRGDFNAIHNMWTPEGDYVDAAGQKFTMREMLSRREAAPRRGIEAADATAPATTLRFIRPDVAIEDGVSGSGLSDEGGAVTGRFTAVWVKRDGRWLLDGLREALVVSPSAKVHLQALQWLLGEWVGTTDDGEILVSSHLSDDGHFIIREFAELVGDQDAICATQRIGWDAAAGKIKCWTFDSQGGTGEGVWQRDGNRWAVEMNLVMPNGEKATTNAVFSPGDRGRFVWETAATKIAGENVPSRRVEFKRADDQ